MTKFVPYLADEMIESDAALLLTEYAHARGVTVKPPIPIEGVVTSLKEEHENSGSRIFSNDRDFFAPHVHSRRAKGSVRPCRSEMTLDVESVVGGCVS
jgi:hypothetical protein